MSEPLQAALGYARRGWRVFPLHGIAEGACTCGRSDCSSRGKHPRIRRGLRAATADPKLVRAWWTRWPEANVAIATGTASGIVVIDLDIPEADGSVTRLEDLGRHLSPTLSALTGAGRHLYYLCRDRRLSNTTRRLPGSDEVLPGIDLRATGGYVVAPPSLHVSGHIYRWIDPGADLAPLPEWIRSPKKHSPAASMASAPAVFDKETPYGIAALQQEIDALLRTPEGSRNDELNRAAFSLGQLIAGGELAEARARAALEAAARRLVLGSRETRSTIESGITAGKSEPRRRAEP